MGFWVSAEASDLVVGDWASPFKLSTYVLELPNTTYDVGSEGRPNQVMRFT